MIKNKILSNDIKKMREFVSIYKPKKEKKKWEEKINEYESICKKLETTNNEDECYQLIKQQLKIVNDITGWTDFNAWYDDMKPLQKKTYLENLKAYKPLDVKTFIGENKEEKTNNKFWFYKKNYKQFIPFLFRKNRKLNFIYFVASKNKYINDIKIMNKRLETFFKNGTQPEYIKMKKMNFFVNFFNKVKHVCSFRQETYKEYMYRKLIGRLSLYQQKTLLLQQLMDINEKIQRGLFYDGITKDKQNIIDKIEQIQIKIYEAQKHK